MTDIYNKFQRDIISKWPKSATRAIECSEGYTFITLDGTTGYFIPDAVNYLNVDKLIADGRNIHVLTQLLNASDYVQVFPNIIISDKSGNRYYKLDTVDYCTYVSERLLLPFAKYSIFVKSPREPVIVKDSK